jgi:hypothetical protein
MATLDELRDSVVHVLTGMTPTIDSARKRTWDPRIDGVLPIVQRAVLVRQYECLDTILYLEKNLRGYAGVVLLRPAVEELIWCKYLDTIDGVLANTLVLLISQIEVEDSLKAQDGYLGRAATKKLGLLTYLERSTRIKTRIRNDLKVVGRKLGWDRKNTEAGTLPSLAFLAKRTGLKREYDYLYHATSRFAHFSAAELLRRAWENREGISITSEHFRTYWSSFALFWGFWVFTQTYLVLQPHLEKDGVIDPDVDGNSIIQAYQRVANFGYVPIITADELKSSF